MFKRISFNLRTCRRKWVLKEDPLLQPQFHSQWLQICMKTTLWCMKNKITAIYLLRETQLYRKTELCFIPKTTEINHATIGNWNILPENHTGTPRKTHQATNSLINSHASSLSHNDIHSFYKQRFRIVMQRHNINNSNYDFWNVLHFPQAENLIDRNGVTTKRFEKCSYLTNFVPFEKNNHLCQI